MADWTNKLGNNFDIDGYSDVMQRKNAETDGSYQAKVSGDYGEFTAKSILKALPNEYYVIDDILLQQGIMRRPYHPEIYGQSKWELERRGNRVFELVKKSTQLDHLVVSPYGIFVIETKNHKGWIFGDMNGRVWTQVLSKGQAKFTFHNPVLQNETHLSELSKQLKIGRQYMTGMIVFTNPDAYLGNIECSCCFTLDKLYDTILCYQKPIWTEKQVEKIILAIEKSDTNSYLKAKEHEKYVQDIKERKEINKRIAQMKRRG